MATYAFSMPIVKGKTETLKKYAQELRGERREQYFDYARKAGLDLEQIWIQHTPYGDMLVVRWETDDPEKIMEYSRTSQDPINNWFREKILVECLNIDLSNPTPPNEQIIDFHIQPQKEKAYTGKQGR
jgi:hypothetical protein